MVIFVPNPNIPYLMNKIILITGAGRGIGKQLVTCFIKQGYTVIATDYDNALLESNINEWNSPNVHLHRLNVTSVPDWEAAFELIKTKFGQLDIIINNAGVLLAMSSEKATPSDIDRQIDINVKGVLYGSTFAAQLMTKQGFGHIINIASLAGITPVPNLSLYCASKFAVRGYTLSLAYDMGSKGVSVTAICPDAVNTKMVQEHLDNTDAGMVFSGTLLSPNDIERAILKAVRTRKVEVYLPWHRGITSKLAGMFPSMVFWLGGFFTKKGLKAQAKYREASK